MKQIDNRINECNNLEEVDNLLKTYTKEFHLYIDIGIVGESTYEFTKKMIDRGDDIVKTTQLALFSFDLLNKGYRIYVHKNGVVLEFKPYMNYKGAKEIRYSHNIEKLFKCGYFDESFN